MWKSLNAKLSPGRFRLPTTQLPRRAFERLTLRPRAVSLPVLEGWSLPERAQLSSWLDALSRAWATWLPLALTLALGAFIRLWAVNAVGFNTDEAVYSGQAAAIAQDPALSQLFPIFRAHPLLFQFVLALTFSFGTSDLVGRLVAVGVGLATIALVYRIGAMLYTRGAGLLAALILALMPYHVVVTRQVLLDGPMALMSTLALYLIARYALSQRPAWLYAAGAAMGLTFLAKETGVILISAIYAFFALAPEVSVRIRTLVLATAAMLLIIASFPISLLLAGGTGTQRAQQYLVWQLFRRPNHEWDFYPTVVPSSLGIGVLVVAALGLIVWRHQRSWREKLLLAWIAVPIVFFQLWPVKGFQYLIPIAPPLAVLAGQAIAAWRPGWAGAFGWELRIDWLRPLVVLLLAVTLLIPSWSAVTAAASDEFLAGTGGVPRGREAGEWIGANTPQGATFMTIGPSMANILQFYGHRRASGLSVSPNPLHRNPSYEPLANPDLLIRSSELQYVVWDSFSAVRSSFFSEALMRYVDRYSGRVVHTETVGVHDVSGAQVQTPVIVIYEVRP
jgi:hypothetical protein